MLFSDPASGELHGYFDGWKTDGCFHYTGEGKRGDQEMVRGNRAILQAKQDGRALRVFKGTGGRVEYQGQFTLDTRQRWYLSDAPETGGGPIRSVIVFRLRPMGTKPQKAQGLPAPARKMAVSTVPIEEYNTEKAFVDPNREPYEAERREAKLVQQFTQFMVAQGYTVDRLKITPVGETKPLFTDLYVKELRLLLEAKGSTDRIAIRMAIGQLTDYRRFAKSGARCAVLLPSRPREDLVELLHFAKITIYCAKDDGFEIIARKRPRNSVSRRIGT